MRIDELFQGIGLTLPHILFQTGEAHLTCDSRRVRKGSVFVALRGELQDGHRFVDDAIQKGAGIIIGEEPPNGIPSDVLYIRVTDSHQTYTQLCTRFFGDLTQKLKLIGVTGTNGKTTTTTLIQHLLNARSRCGLIGTVCYDTLWQKKGASNTTPRLEDLYLLFTEMLSARAQFCAMEVSSHALKQKRVEGLHFTQTIFTNLTQDHLDYHKTFEDYFESKKRLFLDHPRALAIVNADGAYGERLIQEIPNDVRTFSIRTKADATARDIQANLEGLQFVARVRGKESVVNSRLSGVHNVYNILVALTSACEMGMSLKEAAAAVESFPGVSGRMERVDCGQHFYVFVDYAHTPDAMENVLQSVKPLARGRILTVFGCGGNRDRTKRPLMGKIASQYSDLTFLTSDNPRQEDPEAILRDVEAGWDLGQQNGHIVELDRRRAIRLALAEAQPQDIVLILGKGHETYQIVGREKFPFSDQEVAREVLHTLDRTPAQT